MGCGGKPEPAYNTLQISRLLLRYCYVTDHTRKPNVERCALSEPRTGQSTDLMPRFALYESVAPYLRSVDFFLIVSWMLFFGLIFMIFTTNSVMKSEIRKANRALCNKSTTFAGTYWFDNARTYIERRSAEIDRSLSFPFFSFILLTTSLIFLGWIGARPQLYQQGVTATFGGVCVHWHYFSVTSGPPNIAPSPNIMAGIHVTEMIGFAWFAVAGCLIRIFSYQLANLSRGVIEPLSYFSFSKSILFTFFFSVAIFHQASGDLCASTTIPRPAPWLSPLTAFIVGFCFHKIPDWIERDIWPKVKQILTVKLGIFFSREIAVPKVRTESGASQDLSTNPRLNSNSLLLLDGIEDDLKRFHDFGITDPASLAATNPFLLWSLTTGPRVELERIIDTQLQAALLTLCGEEIFLKMRAVVRDPLTLAALISAEEGKPNYLASTGINEDVLHALAISQQRYSPLKFHIELLDRMHGSQRNNRQ